MHACYVHELILSFKLDFAQLACFWAMISGYVALNMLFYDFLSVFLSFGPRKFCLMNLMLNLSLVIKYENSKNLIHARAGNFMLEREMHIPRSSSVLQFARARKNVLKRGSESHARAGVERPSNVKIFHPVLLSILQSARARKFTLEWSFNICMSARVG